MGAADDTNYGVHHDFGKPKDAPCAFEPQWCPRESLDIPACFCEVSVGRPPTYRQEACVAFLLRQLQRYDASAQSASDDQHVAVLVVGASSLYHVNISPFMVIGQALRVTRRHDVCVLDWWAVIPHPHLSGVNAMTGTHLDWVAAACSYLP